MAIEAGRRLGTFEVVSRLGVGGMGEVYRARDSRLGREVAIKVLPEGVASDPERLARFDREARALASLSHPNVGAIHGAEEADGIRFLVLELIPGDTLGDRIRRGALKLDEALRLACQIAAAVEAAHERGIVHRDLKPANVKVTPQGQVKVLDFGLARMLAPAGESGAAIAAVVDHETQHGAILGTPAYMSPEQARGQSADKRSDVWAFGCLLYEMLTGRKAFLGDTVTDVMAGVLSRDPDWRALPAGTPGAVRRLLAHCLRRDREHRLHDIADARIEMEDVLAALQAGTPEPEGAALMSRRRALALAGGGAAAGALLSGAGVYWTMRPRAAGPRPRLNIATPAEAPIPDAGAGASAMALSPDGQTLAFIGYESGSITTLWVRSLVAPRARLVPGTEGAVHPFFSPDGKWLGFFSNGMLRRTHVDTGEPQGIAQAGRVRGAAWGDDGNVVYASFSGPLMIVDTIGGRPRPLTTVEAGSQDAHRWPDVLPGGQGVLFTVMKTTEARAIAVVPMSGGAPRVLVEEGVTPRYVRGGYLTFARKGTLMAVPFDARTLRLGGTPVPVLDDVHMADKGSGGAHYAVSRSGSLAYVAGYPRPPERTLVWVDRKGNVQPLAQRRDAYSQPRLSPDGRRLAVAIYGDSEDLWTYDLARETWARLTFEGGTIGVVWSPDGQQIAFASNRKGAWQVYVVSADGGPARQITTGQEWRYPSGFSPDGRLLACVQHSNQDVEVVIARVDGSGPPVPLGTGARNESYPVFSPDGRWIAYSADMGNGNRVFVGEAGGGRRWAVSTGEGREPMWSRDGRQVYFRQGTQFFVADVQPGPQFAASRPRPLFQVPLAVESTSLANYDVAPDGSRFVAVQASPKKEPAREVVYVPDWADELREKLRG
jgi:eukaryotic-like serine/threonine-protein kinase